MLLEVKDINTYRGPAHILRGVSISVDTDEVVALVGRNGAGRTTIIESVIGLLPVRSGQIRFRDEEDVVSQANDTPYGLAAYFYSRDIARIWRVADRLETGIVGINEGAVASEAAPFGGIKESGYGREGSRYGLSEYLHTKYLCHGQIA